MNQLSKPYAADLLCGMKCWLRVVNYFGKGHWMTALVHADGDDRITPETTGGLGLAPVYGGMYLFGKGVSLWSPTGQCTL